MMTIKEALKICKAALAEHEGGLQAYYDIVDILEDAYEEEEDYEYFSRLEEEE